MRYRVLGPVLVEDERGTRPVSGGKVRTVLAALLLHANRELSVTQLADRMWHREPPASPRRAVQTNIVRLRQELPWPGAIVTGSTGYVLRVAPGELDLHVFDQLIAEAATAGSPEHERRLLHRALELWRDQPCADVASPVLHDLDVAPLQERRLLALERRIAIDMRLGRLDGLVTELHGLTAEHPFRERFWAQLLTALYRQGRQAEALGAYHTVSHRLIGELGVEPGSELRELHQRMLRGDALAPAGRVTVAAAASVPAVPAHTVGHGAELAALDKHLGDADPDTAAIAVIDGPAGIGKSALAARWLHAHAEAFPDGMFHLDLNGFADGPPLEPAQALAALLGEAGATGLPDGVPARARLWRSLTARRRIAVLLDNAADADQVRPLLPGPGSTVLVTSRDQLRALVGLDGADRVTVGRLDHDESVAVLSACAGRDLAAQEHQARQLADLCDRNPLALRLLAERIARLPDVPLRSWVQDLHDAAGRIAAIDDGAARHLHRRLSWSYRRLDPSTAALARRLGDRCFTVADAAQPAHSSRHTARRHLDRLVAVHLVEQLDYDRFRLHPLAALYGRHHGPVAVGSEWGERAC